MTYDMTIEGKSKEKITEHYTQHYMEYFTPPETETPPTVFHQASLYAYSRHTYITDSTSVEENDT